MNLFERLILRRLMNVAGEGGEGGAPATGNEEQQQGQQEQQTPASLSTPANLQGSNRDNNRSNRVNSRRPRRLLKNCLTMATKKAGRIYTRNWAARKKSKTTVLNHRKAAMGHF